MFIDLVKIHIKSGQGGNGAVAWRREKYVPRGGPAGGDGGKGGDVILKADKSLSTLLEFKYKSIYEAENGENGRSKNMHGKNAKELLIRVPVGTMVRDTASGAIIADLVEDGQEALVAAGGRGGRGNASFASSTRQAPQFCEPGEAGIERELELELKLLADIGLVGMPNAGKSTLISVVSAAKPKIAAYPFTTLIPNLGVVKTPDGEGVVIADIPGLIQGASEGVGLGHQFLRHVERTRILIHIIDVLEEDPVKNYEIINNELQKYSEHLATLEQVIALNKIDAAPSEIVEDIRNQLNVHNHKIYAISAATTTGVQELMNFVFERLKEIPRELYTVDIEEDTAAYDSDDSAFVVTRHNRLVYVEGGKVERLVNVTDLTNMEAVYRLQNILKAMGVFDELKEVGAQEGDLVIIGNFEFDYIEDV
jgi:GTP-binding protein